MKAANVPELKTGQMMTIVYILALLIVLFIVYKVLAGIGLIKTGKRRRAEKEQEEAVNMMRKDEYWNPLYIQNKVYKSIGKNAAIEYASNLRRAMQGWGTNEERIFSTFGKLYNKCNVSEVALAYYVNYNENLQADLLNELTDSEVATLMNIVNGLPNK
jgi:hypothetical protein